MNSNASVLLTTARTRLRAFGIADVDLLFELGSDLEVMRFISKGESTPRSMIEENILPRWLEYYRNPSPHGFWAIELLASDAFIGWVHLRTDRISPPELELGYRLQQKAWGRGLAAECSQAIITLAFEIRLTEFISARTLETNLASQRVMQKCGLTFREKFLYSTDLLPGWTEAERRAVKYGIARDEWLRRTS
jgi:RimJ/RimL family protein N-acetyltransferase